MCLHRVTDDQERPGARGEGFRVLKREPDGLWSPIQLAAGPYQIGVEVDARDHHRSAFTPVGFYVFLREEDARRYAIERTSEEVYRVNWRHQMQRGVFRLDDEEREALLARFVTIEGPVDSPQEVTAVPSVDRRRDWTYRGCRIRPKRGSPRYFGHASYQPNRGHAVWRTRWWRVEFPDGTWCSCRTKADCRRYVDSQDHRLGAA